MKQQSYAQYLAEMDNWLHRGRRRLLQICLESSTKAVRHDGERLQVLEVGAGGGGNVKTLALFGEVDTIEVNPQGLASLRTNEHVRRIYSDPVPFNLDRTYDIICAMDVLEHVSDDRAVFQWMVDHLADGGTLFVTVPAFQFLFSDHDVALEHYRRYRLRELVALNRTNLTVAKRGYFVFALFPLVAAQRLVGRLVSRRSTDQPAAKQTSNVPPAVNRLLFGLLELELGLLRRLPLYPVGLTAFAVFRN